jgi:hypothetical protein
MQFCQDVLCHCLNTFKNVFACQVTRLIPFSIFYIAGVMNLRGVAYHPKYLATGFGAMLIQVCFVVAHFCFV